MLGVVENMAEIRLAMRSLGDPLSGVRLFNALGEDVTEGTVNR